MLNSRLSNKFVTIRARRITLLFAIALAVLSPGRAYGQEEGTIEVADSLGKVDDQLSQQLAFVFGGFDEFSSVDSRVHGKVVHLTGTVSDVRHRDQAGDLAAAVPGVLYVINNIETTLAVDVRVAPAVERVRRYISDFFDYLPVLAIALIVLALFSLAAAYVGRVNAPYQRLGLTPLLSNLVSRLLRFVIFVLGVVLALDVLGITSLVGAILGTAGLVGIAIGFAFQDIIENYLAGLILSVRQPFSLGDQVRISDEEGKVVRLTARELVLMSLDGNHVTIPNALVFKSRVVNYNRNPRRRFSFDIGIDVGADLAEVSDVGTETLKILPGVMADPGPAVRIKELGDSTVVVSFFGWVDQTVADFGKVRSEAIRLVKSAFDQSGIGMPDPTFNVRMQSVQSISKTPTSPTDSADTSVPVVEQARRADVTVETELNKQIEEDLESSDEPNLLSPGKNQTL